MNRRSDGKKLAVDGGPKAVSKAIPPRGLLDEKEKNAVAALFDQAIAAGQAIGYNGEQEEEYCREFAEALGGGYADAVNSGTNAIYVALRALELPAFSEVIVPPISDPGGVMPVPLCNLIPIIADAQPGSFNAGPDEIAARITRRTSAVIVAHIAGEPADMASIMKLARKHKLAVIEDCAQSHGAVYRGKPCGTIGTAGAFSTMHGKHHCTGGQGGVVYTRSKKLYWKIRQCADRGKPFGLPSGTRNVVASLNMNLNEISACIGRVQLKKLKTIVRRRRAVAEKIRDGVAKLEAVHAPPLPRGAEPSYWFLRLALELGKLTVTKEEFCKALAAEGVPAVGPSYRHIASEFPWFQERRVCGTPGLPWTSPLYKGNPDKDYPVPNAIAATDACFNVGVHEKMRVSDGAAIVKALAKVEAAYLRSC